MSDVNLVTLNRLKSLPRLSRSHSDLSAVPCKICGFGAEFFDVVDFNKCPASYPFGPATIPVPYYRCTECSFIFTPFCDNWSVSDFREIIYNDDYILVDPDYASSRPRGTAERVAKLLDGNEQASILDYGAGSGIFAQRMRELGFPHVASYDPFSNPERPTTTFQIITCIEVIEHCVDPVSTMLDMSSLLAPGGSIFLGTSLQPQNIEEVRGNWWYVSPRNGHVSIFSEQALASLAGRLGMTFYLGNLLGFRRSHEENQPDPPLELGPAFTSVRLGAPGEARPGEWNGVEETGLRRFQWTEASVLSWPLVLPPGPARQLQVVIPFAHESRRQFAAECSVEVNKVRLTARTRGPYIVAEGGPFSEGPFTINLRTPPPTDSPGGRKLGLAIKVAPTTIPPTMASR